ncbi:MAG: manganese efflux pump [Clostridia bacterium]|nr:manganese efflux pump [Clostridia bacterium]
MNLTVSFFITGVMLGVGLAMDAFSVSLANGLNEPEMKGAKMCGIAGVFAGFQFVMPLIGWFCVSAVAHIFVAFQKFIPWIALILLSLIGGKMIYESVSKKAEDEKPAVGLGGLMLQGVATSIDALSVGFTISDYTVGEALVSCAVIGTVTFIICFAGLAIGKKAGTKLAGKAGILGGVILIGIGFKIFIKSVFFGA